MGDLPLFYIAQGEPVDHHPALAGFDFSDEQFNDGRFSAAGGADHKHELPVLYFHRKPVEGVGAVRVLLYNISQTNHALPSSRFDIKTTINRNSDKNIHNHDTLSPAFRQESIEHFP